MDRVGDWVGDRSSNRLCHTHNPCSDILFGGYMTQGQINVVIIAFIVMLTFVTGVSIGYIYGEDSSDRFCSDIFSRINVDNIEMDVNVTPMMNWMESRGYELGCKEYD